MKRRSQIVLFLLFPFKEKKRSCGSSVRIARVAGAVVCNRSTRGRTDAPGKKIHWEKVGEKWKYK